jgi:hypothetical protein
MLSLKRTSFTKIVASHLQMQTTAGLDAFQNTDAWIGTQVPSTGAYPSPYTRPSGGSPRMYRNMHAPGGYNFYYHQADLVAAKTIGLTDEVSGYWSHFAANCILNNGIFCWGSHYYWDAQANALKRFTQSETPATITKSQSGDYEEIRPTCPAWDLIWSELGGAAAVENHIDAMTPLHIKNNSTGEFNRHSNSSGQMHAFLEWLGPQVATLAFLYGKTNDASYLTTADLMIGYAWGGRNVTTGLVVNCRNSATNRWDRFVATTELGVMAYHLMLASEGLPSGTRSDWVSKAEGTVEPYLEYGWDAEERKFYGQLLITDGSPVFGVAAGTQATVFRPGDYANPWVDLFPAHDYPQHMALACCELFAETSEPAFRLGIERFAEQFRASLPGSGNSRSFIIHYAYLIWFFCRANEVTGKKIYRDIAWEVAEECVSFHFVSPGFRSSNLPGWNEHGDGTGFLLLALLYLQNGQQPDLMGMVL